MVDALVLAGGGVAGIAWELGVLRGLADEDPALADRLIGADIVVGTSAGSAVAAQITSGTPLADLYDAQLAPSSAELEVELDLDEFVARMGEATQGVTDAGALRRRIGAMALATPTLDEQTRLASVAARLPRPEWPLRTVLIPAVDATTGEVVVFDRDSGVALVDAVAASCAVPGVWPPVTIGDRRFVDGGVRSASNADLAAGADRIVVLTPTMENTPIPLGGDLNDEIDALRPGTTHVVWADEASAAAFGTNPLSPATRGPAARAGRAIGRSRAAAVRGFLGA
ncbi:patatin-like phospholipase family protein [Cryptosporangium phraense]|uniref:Patatin-like phospholipase family protein n=1 Tax=Cryptosporangium phraense TaxID=2593070 RepID=A0A545AVE9_9ACTN|nr:patatin-like phospholipase family protein [Cryptosporangium phraense]TQS45261.1 patatin-like phospholipase family protein [Cryptosporangium phraense]